MDRNGLPPRNYTLAVLRVLIGTTRESIFLKSGSLCLGWQNRIGEPSEIEHEFYQEAQETDRARDPGHEVAGDP